MVLIVFCYYSRLTVIDLVFTCTWIQFLISHYSVVGYPSSLPFSPSDALGLFKFSQFWTAQLGRSVVIIISNRNVCQMYASTLSIFSHSLCCNFPEFINIVCDLSKFSKIVVRLILKVSEICINLATIILHFLMFYQSFLSPQVKRIVVISNKHDVFELPNEFLNDL